MIVESELRQCREKGSVLIQLISQRLLQGKTFLSHLRLSSSLFSEFLYLLTSSPVTIRFLHLHCVDSTSGAEVLWRLPVGLKKLWIEGGSGVEQLYETMDIVGKEDTWALCELKELRLEGVRMDREGEVKVGKLVKRLKGLERLELVNCGIESRECEVLGEALLRLPSLLSLSLSSNSLRDSGMLLLSSVLPNLLSLSLNCCHLSKSGLTALLSSLPASTATLELASNALAGEGMEAFEIYAERLRGLQTLDVSGNDMGPEGMQHLVLFLRTVNALKTLRLDCNYIGSIGFAYMLTAFYMRHLDAGARGKAALEVLGLSMNDLEAGALSKLAPQLQQLYEVKQLDLSTNHIGPVGAATLSPVLPYFPNLQCLNLNDTSLHDSGLTSLSVSLRRLPYLRTLLLGSNSITTRGLRALTREIKSLPELEELGLAGNQIGDSAVDLVLEDLWACLELRTIDFTNCPLSLQTLTRLAPRFLVAPL